MNRLLPLKLTHRQRKIWWAVLGVLLGTAAITALAMWVQVSRNTDLGDPTAGITEFDAERGAAPVPPIRFRDLTTALGIITQHGPPQRHRRLCEDTGSGLAWADYDGDGDFDLYVVNDCPDDEAAPPESSGSHLFRNDGERFTDVTAAAGAANIPGRGMGASWADYDDDGQPDLYVTNFGGPNRLYHNQGDGTFREQAAEAGVADSIWSTGTCWGDFDRDGNVDLYVCSYIDYDTRSLPTEELLVERGRDSIGVPVALNPNAFDPLPNRLYHSLGDGRFEDVAAQAGVANPEGRSFSAAFADLDDDGWLDLYVANDVSPNALFRNMAGQPDLVSKGPNEASFWNLSAVTGTADFRGSMGLSVVETGDMTGVSDGLPDLFYTNWLAQENALYQSLRMPSGDIEYRDRSRNVKLAEDSLDMVGWGCGFADLDLDGRQDLVVANGNTLEQPPDRTQLIPQRMFVYWSDGKTFRNLAAEAGQATAAPWCARGLAVADYDDDGLADVAVSVNRGNPLLLHNETSTQNRGLKVRLRGPSAACFGAKVEVTVGTQRQFRWWGADVSYLSGHAPELIFGLGENRQADRVQVTWADGRVTELTGVPAGTVRAAAVR